MSFCVYAYVYIHIHVYIYLHIKIYTYTYIYVYLYYIYIYMCIYVCFQTYLFLSIYNMCTHIFMPDVNVYVHTCMNKYMSVYIRRYIYVNQSHSQPAGGSSSGSINRFCPGASLSIASSGFGLSAPACCSPIRETPKLHQRHIMVHRAIYKVNHDASRI